VHSPPVFYLAYMLSELRRRKGRTCGRDLARGDSRDALLNAAYARRSGIEVGATLELGSRSFEVVGLVQSPLGGQASDERARTSRWTS
jgi:hypothetical protein